jgi:hypothetical protein
VQTLKGASVIPQAAVIESPRGKIVYVVEGNKAMPRPVELVYASGEEAAVSGVRPGERIVLDGRQNLRPGATVIERAPNDAGKGGRRGPGSSPAGSASALPASASGAAVARGRSA